MKVLCVIDSLGSGGAQRQMSWLALGLKERGHDVELFLYQPSQSHFRPTIEAAGIAVHEVSRHGRKGFSLRVLWHLIGHFSRDFDAVISFQPTANFYSALARMTAPSLTLVAGERTSSATGVSSKRRLIGWMAALLSNLVVANSESNAAYLRGFPGLSKKVFAIWNGYASKAGPIVKNRQGLARLLIVARVSPEKNGLRLMEALALFLERNGWVPEVSWAGRRDSDPACRQIQEEMDRFLVDHPEVAAHWSWLGEVKNVQELYDQADALILPSLFEGLPNAVCEAMLAGCPVIASNVCDHPRLLGQSGDRGLLCDPLSSQSICAALEDMHGQTMQERAEMVRRARSFAQERLSLERMVENYECLLCGSKS